LNMIPAQGICKFAYCGLYQTGANNRHQLALGYNPMSPKDAISVAFLTKPSQRLQLFSELKGNFDGQSSHFLAGFRLRFLQGSVTGYMDSAYKCCSTFTTSITESGIPLKIDWFSMIEFAHPRKKCNFGVGVTVGQG